MVIETAGKVVHSAQSRSAGGFPHLRRILTRMKTTVACVDFVCNYALYRNIFPGVAGTVLKNRCFPQPLKESYGGDHHFT